MPPRPPLRIETIFADSPQARSCWPGYQRRIRNQGVSRNTQQEEVFQ